ncbi:hypothetical protein H6F67_12660 [Microcoleus sp. FACHB-1515]|uniref:hypothetical protein n=1 Tax=Cyanophyceae TaxID=3028117 RepID=UPI0016894E8F|nr:hypothetical protein [Microcoleus sp. FACHB-1515]MBD2090706.1 hypothetical protein [Microcoleus sp. FACHB-1515]
MRDRIDRNPVSKVSVIGKAHQQAASQAGDRQARKRLGDYLVEAGLLTKAQIDVALNDQHLAKQEGTPMKFGEILATRGWVKQQTIDYFMKKLVVPERRKQAEAARVNSPAPPVEPVRPAPTPDRFVRREAPISKPLPSVKSTDGDVNWVG